MKKQLITILTALAIVLISVCCCKAQSRVTKDAQGNYSVAKRDTAGANKPTGHTFTDSKGKVYPLYRSVRGKLFYIRVSKAGNSYKVYIKEE